MNNDESSPAADSRRHFSQQPVYYSYGPDASDSIDLVHVISGLWKRRWLITGLTALFAIGGVIYASVATPVYRADVVLAFAHEERGSGISSNLGGLASLAGINLAPQGNSMKALATMRSRAFVESFIVDNRLLPVLFSSQWNAEEEMWISDVPEEHPDIRDAVRFFTNTVRSINEDEDTGLITLSIDWTDAEIAANWVEELVERVNEQLRERDMAEARRRLQYLQGQLQNANLVELRQAISRLIENQMQTIMLAQAKSEYAFAVIDPPRVPDRPVRPRKVLIVALMTFCGGLFGVFCALVLNAYNDRIRPSHVT